MFIKKLPIVAIGLVLALFCDTTVAQSNFYVHGSFSNSNTDILLGGLNHVDDDNSSYALGAGYAFTPNVSLEAAYRDFGSHNGETDCPPDFTCLIIPVLTKADLTGISLSLIGSIPLTERLDMFGKVGFTSWNVDFDGISAAFDDSGEDFLYGAGLRWSIDDRWKVFAEYERHDLDLNSAAIGVNFYF
jgi:OOP family OmpA-OmpF porin